MCIIYKLLRKALCDNYNYHKQITKKRIKKIKEYCELVISFDKLPEAIRYSFKMILEDYIYLYFTDNVEYFNQEEFENEEIYLEDIREDVKKSLSINKVTKEEMLMIVTIAKNNEKVLDSSLTKLFRSLLI